MESEGKINLGFGLRLSLDLIIIFDIVLLLDKTFELLLIQLLTLGVVL